MMLAFSFTIIAPALFVPIAEATPEGDLVNEMNAVYQYIDINGRQALADTRQQLNNLVANDPNGTNPNGIEPVITPLINAMNTTQAGIDAVNALGGEAATRQELVNIAGAVGSLYYTSDSAEMQNRLTTLKTNYKDTFYTLFGNNVTLDYLANYLIASRGKFTMALNTPNSSLTEAERTALGTTLRDAILFGDNSKLVVAMPILVKYAMRAAIADYPDFDQKLSNIGWSTDLLVAQHNILANLVDNQTRDAELALARASVRSQAAISKGGVTINPVGITREDTIPFGTDVSYILTIMGQDATGLVDWVSSNTNVATLDNVADMQLHPVATGTTEIIAYRANGIPADDWILKLNVTVQATVTYGDVNNDGAIDINDVVLVAKNVAGTHVFNANQAIAANVNGDNTIDINDVVLIAKHVAGTLPTFPVQQ